MARASSGDSATPPSLLGEVSGVWEMCPSPCNRGCAPLECTVKLPKNMYITLGYDEELKHSYIWLGAKEDNITLSVANYVRTVSNRAEAEEVCVYDMCDDKETLKAVCESMKFVSSLKSLGLNNIDPSQLSSADAKAIFNVLKGNNTLQKCEIKFNLIKPIMEEIVHELVDALLQNEVLQQLTLEFCGPSTWKSRSKEAIPEAHTVMRELSRYMKAPTNVLTTLRAWNLSDDEVVQLADMLRDNKQLRSLDIKRLHFLHGKGVGRIGEALSSNTILEEFWLSETSMAVDEMKALVEALIPDAVLGLQSNTRLHTLGFHGSTIQGKEGMEQLATLIRSNTSLFCIGLLNLVTLRRGNENVAEYAEMLFTSLRSNASLRSLDLAYCSGIGGKHILGMIMDMLLYNHTLREIGLHHTGLDEDGNSEVVYAELRTRGEVDRKLEQALRTMEHVVPNSARVFLCGDPEAGKTTLCDRWKEIHDKQVKQLIVRKKKEFFRRIFVPSTTKKSKTSCQGQKLLQLSEPSERTRGIEVHKLTWEGMDISLWDMAGQLEYHAFHDVVLPNQSAKGEGCFYFIVCDPSKYWNDVEQKLSLKLEGDIQYWLMFLASNTRRSASYRPHVTILMTHHDLWCQSDKILAFLLKKIVAQLKNKFQHVLDFDQDLEFIPMDNKKSCDDAQMVKGHVEEYLKQLSLKLPKILKASVELQTIVIKWCEDHVNDHMLKWEDFSKHLCEEVEELKPWKYGDEEFLEKLKRCVATSLHSSGHIMYFEDIAMVIMNPHWFCNHVIGNILYYCSKLSNASESVENGIISQDDFTELCKEALGLGSYKDRLKDVFEVMKKLQICYEDHGDKIMIPSLLTNKQDAMDWTVAFYACTQAFNYVGTRLVSNDDTITLPTEGFYPRLQVYLHDKYDSSSYKIYMNVISFIYNDIHVFVTRKDGAINIMSRSCGDGDHANHALHKMIVNHINDLRQKPTLGCPGVIFEEHIMWPRCVEHPFHGRLQSVSKKALKEMVLHTGDLKYAHHWTDEEGCCEFTYASKLLGDEEWHKILESRDRMMKEMDKELDQRLGVSKEMHSSNSPATLEDESLSNPERILAKLDSIKRLMQCNHKEVMERLNVMESRIIRSQEALVARVCSNMDRLMPSSLYLKNSKMPKLPYIMRTNGTGTKHILLKMVPGLTTCRVHFRCEHNDHGFHLVDDQPGCEIRIGTDNTRKVGVVLFWGLMATTMLLKVGAHLVAGMGSMVPDLAREFATILDTPGLLDMAQPRGRILECLPSEFKSSAMISVEDNEQAKDWLMKLMQCQRKSIYDMFKLTEVVYTSKSSKKQEIGWVCDAHKR